MGETRPNPHLKHLNTEGGRRGGHPQVQAVPCRDQKPPGKGEGPPLPGGDRPLPGAARATLPRSGPERPSWPRPRRGSPTGGREEGEAPPPPTHPPPLTLAPRGAAAALRRRRRRRRGAAAMPRCCCCCSRGGGGGAAHQRRSQEQPPPERGPAWLRELMTLQPAGWRAATRGAAARRGLGGRGAGRFLRLRRPGARPRVPPASYGAGTGEPGSLSLPPRTALPAAGPSARPFGIALAAFWSLFAASRDRAIGPCGATRGLGHPGCQAEPSVPFLLRKTPFVTRFIFQGKFYFLAHPFWWPRRAALRSGQGGRETSPAMESCPCWGADESFPHGEPA